MVSAPRNLMLHEEMVVVDDSRWTHSQWYFSS